MKLLRIIKHTIKPKRSTILTLLLCLIVLNLLATRGNLSVLFEKRSVNSLQERVLTLYNNSSDHWSSLFQKPPGLKCGSYIEGETAELKKAIKKQTLFKRLVIHDEKYAEITKDCEEFKRIRGYPSEENSNDSNFSIAYSILLYKEAEQAEILLRAIYDVNNLYCIHVDSFSPLVLHQAMQSIANCFPNVFIVSKSEKVVYAGITRLLADINCMRDLVKHKKNWQYFINLPSQAFPLKTNSELTKILKIYNGANDIEGLPFRKRLPGRYSYVHVHVRKNGKLAIERTNKTKTSAPHNITIVKGSAYGVFSRGFVEFVLKDPIARDLLEWCNDVYSPDEYFWATLHHLKYNKFLTTPGGYKGELDHPWLATYAAWAGVDRCHGRWLRGVCIFGLEDLQMLVSRKELFINKFMLNVHPYALHCMEEWIQNKTETKVPTELYFYRKLPFIYQEKS